MIECKEVIPRLCSRDNWLFPSPFFPRFLGIRRPAWNFSWKPKNCSYSRKLHKFRLLVFCGVGLQQVEVLITWKTGVDGITTSWSIICDNYTSKQWGELRTKFCRDDGGCAACYSFPQKTRENVGASLLGIFLRMYWLRTFWSVPEARTWYASYGHHWQRCRKNKSHPDTPLFAS